MKITILTLDLNNELHERTVIVAKGTTVLELPMLIDNRFNEMFLRIIKKH